MFEKTKAWLGEKFGKKSFTVQVLVGDDGFMVAQSFTGGDLYTVYTQAIWTYICASRIAQDISNFPGIVQTRGADGSWVTDHTHRLNEVLERPYGPARNAPAVNWQQALATGVLRQELSGNQWWRIVAAGGQLTALGLYLVQLRANTVPGAQTPLLTSWSPSGSNFEIPPERVVNIQHANPSDLYTGVSPTVANEQATRVDYAASRRTRYDMETRVAPGVVFKVKALFTMSTDKRTAAETWLANQYEGATKAGKSMVVGDNTEIQGAPLHQVDDIPTHAANARDAIISSFDVSPPMVGVLRDARYQSWENAQRAQFNLCILPRLNNIYGTVNSQVITPIYGRDVRFWYDLVQSPLGLAAIRERGESAQVYQQLGYPANALNRFFALGMPYFDELDRPNMPLAIAGREDEAPTDDDEETDDEETEPQPAQLAAGDE